MFLKTALSLVFPSPCLECKRLLEDPFAYLCKECNEAMHFSPAIDCCFGVLSPAKKIVLEYEKTKSDKLLKLLGSFFILKIAKSRKEFPECITYFPEEKVSLFKRKCIWFDVARYLSRQLNIPLLNLFSLEISAPYFDESGEPLFQITRKKEESRSYLCIGYQKTDAISEILRQDIFLEALFFMEESFSESLLEE